MSLKLLSLDVVPSPPPCTVDRVLSMLVYRAGGSQVDGLAQVLSPFFLVNPPACTTIHWIGHHGRARASYVDPPGDA